MTLAQIVTLDPDSDYDQRIDNFSAGPAVLPEPVLRKAEEAIWNVAGSGIGIMEHSHRGKVFDKLITEAEETCRRLAGIPDDLGVRFSRAAHHCSSPTAR